MANEFSLVNLGAFSKPAIVFIEKISDAIGGVFKPWQIKRVAKAEAAADLIHVEAKIEASELSRRALARMIKEEEQRQENIESITFKAVPKLSLGAAPEKLEKDWLVYFFDKSRLTSDDDM